MFLFIAQGSICDLVGQDGNLIFMVVLLVVLGVALLTVMRMTKKALSQQTQAMDYMTKAEKHMERADDHLDRSAEHMARVESLLERIANRDNENDKTQKL